jgi:hypothetical protein
MRLPPTFRAAEFHKASASSPHQNCVRVARREGWTAIWDDKLATGDPGPLPPGELLFLTDSQFDTFQSGVRIGDTAAPLLTVTRRPDGRYGMRAATAQPVQGVELVFDADELDAFFYGVRNHEFDPA